MIQLLLRICLVTLTAIATLASGGAAAHEFWMLPDKFVVAPGESVRVSLAVGQNFVGDTVGISPTLVTRLRRFSATVSVDLLARLPRQPVGQIAIALPRAGSYVIALDTHPSEIALEAPLFHAYLRDEGLDWVIAAREADGTAASPGRERYRRNIKTLVQAGDKPDASYRQRTGQRLEIVPLADPSDPRNAASASFQVFFDNRPLANALLKFWRQTSGKSIAIRAISDGNGMVTATLAPAGVWMASVVHMTRVTDSPDHDWDSHWGNLTFRLAGAP